MKRSLFAVAERDFIIRYKRCDMIKNILAAAVLAAAILTAGCGGKEASEDTLDFGVNNFAESLEPMEDYFGWALVRYGVGETLVKFDDKMQPVPWLAKSWSISDDKLTWTFVIDDRAVFSNGDKVTAQIVKESLERVFAKAKRAEVLFTYEEMIADGQILKIRTSRPVPTLPGILADPLFLIIDTKAMDRDIAHMGPVCTGPYRVLSFSRERTEMEANPYYWQGQVPFKHLNIVSVDDPNTRAMALQSGEVDLAVAIAPGNLELFKNGDFHISELTSLRVVLARMNMHEGRPLHDPLLRAALISSLDRETYNKVLLKDNFLTGKAPVPPSMDYGFDSLHDPNAYDPQRAKALLAQAGWSDSDGNGYVDKNGRDLELELVYFSNRAELPLYAEATQSDAAKVGIKVKLTNVDVGAFPELGRQGKFDLLLAGFLTANSGDPESYLNWYWKSNTDGSNTQNVSGYASPRFDALSSALATEFDTAKRRQLIVQMQQLLLDDAAAVFYGYPKTNMVSKSTLKNAEVYPADYYWITSNITF